MFEGYGFVQVLLCLCIKFDGRLKPYPTVYKLKPLKHKSQNKPLLYFWYALVHLKWIYGDLDIALFLL
jgi:hypothetical protein